ncbi:hypothetical protein BV25DRAFT_120890 [Artomyces pyxidatus]|uniref:Uncharacterized protein n=1 Tax=Artomyces pyxidatus TaxID=48021 RepID=A0ACB8TLD8_9AGAM|nr:hypothetical protein BV25DRAFT_120890 [Artomyces pyxidatus]
MSEANSTSFCVKRPQWMDIDARKKRSKPASSSSRPMLSSRAALSGWATCVLRVPSITLKYWTFFFMMMSRMSLRKGRIVTKSCHL